MEALQFNKLLLKTAFSCMACDGDIDDSEIKLIKDLHNSQKTFGEIEIDKEHLKPLIDKKIVKELDGFIVIEFLDEQMDHLDLSVRLL